MQLGLCLATLLYKLYYTRHGVASACIVIDSAWTKSNSLNWDCTSRRRPRALSIAAIVIYHVFISTHEYRHPMNISTIVAANFKNRHRCLLSRIYGTLLSNAEEPIT